MTRLLNPQFSYSTQELEDMDLYSYQRKFEKNINMSTVKLIMKQILDGCSYLHSNNVMHRDLKPDNILICTGTSAIRIADFGYARSFTHTINSAISSVRYSWPIQVG
jgi:cyclin-dependent kinase 8/11